MKTKIFDINRKEVGEIEMSDVIFGRDWNADLVHQILVSIEANRRQPWAHTKTRGDVRGGGKKPWRQKGTGRARHGSTRSPIWVGGGVAHGPRKDRDYSKKINKKMLRAGLYTVLSKKLADGELLVVDSLTASGKTKDLAKSLNGFFKTKRVPSTLLITGGAKLELNKAARNIPKLGATLGKNIGVYDLLNHKHVLLEKEAVNEIK